MITYFLLQQSKAVFWLVGWLEIKEYNNHPTFLPGSYILEILSEKEIIYWERAKLCSTTTRKHVIVDESLGMNCNFISKSSFY